MNLANMQSDVEAFHRAAGVQIGDLAKPSLPDGEVCQLRISLIQEELRELVEALQMGDLVEAADAIIDLLYVTVGAGVAFGLDLAPLWNEVQRSNMAKFPGGVVQRRADGKILKPAGWQAPNLADVIRAQIVERFLAAGDPDGAFDWSDTDAEEPTLPFVRPGSEA